MSYIRRYFWCPLANLKLVINIVFKAWEKLEWKIMKDLEIW